MPQEENKKKGCDCETETPEMMLWGFIGFVVGMFVSWPFHNKWATIIAVILFASLFSELCREWQKRKQKKEAKQAEDKRPL